MVLGLGGDGGGKSITLLGTIISWVGGEEEGGGAAFSGAVQLICRDLTFKLFHSFRLLWQHERSPVDLSGVPS